MYKAQSHLDQVHKALITLLKPERSFFGVVIAYSVAIGLLTLAVPIAVQTLINTVANIASPRSVTVLALVLFFTLLLSGFFAALRTKVMECYERHVYARLVSEISLRTILTPHSFFEGSKNISITHRYFDIMTLQKNIPSLMVDGVALILQMLVGFTLVAFYHPFLLAFNLCVLLAMYTIWRLWATQAKTTAIELSESKYATAKWLSNLAAAHEYVKSALPFQFAAKKTETYISSYTISHERHFSFTFKQIIMFLLLYAVASAALLGLGGRLVIAGQLSIGQLVAAELIMSAVFLGLSRFSYYLKLYYELFGTADKVGGVFAIPQEASESSLSPTPVDGSIEFNKVIVKSNNEKSEFNFKLNDKAKTYIVSQSNWTQRCVVKLLKKYSTPESGWISIGKHDIQELDSYKLRQSVFVVDRSLILECSIADYLKMSSPEVTLNAIKNVIDKVGLRTTVENLPDGIDTILSPVGSPLQPLEFILLKLASALLSAPKVVILNQHFDAIPDVKRSEVLELIADIDATVLYFTNSPINKTFWDILEIEVGADSETISLTEMSLSKENGQ